jgi:hypothetical protein
MPESVSSGLRRRVIEGAGNRCEYCRLSQMGQEATFHIDHIKPLIREGTTDLENLALACVSCSLRKGARERVLDPTTGTLTRLFNPRSDNWQEHFAWTEDVFLTGLTEIGRATVAALDLNRPLIVAIRREEMTSGRHPPA